MCSVRFSRKPNIHDKREKKQNFMTKPSQYPETITRPMRHIHHSTIVWLDRVVDGVFQIGLQFTNPPQRVCRALVSSSNGIPGTGINKGTHTYVKILCKTLKHPMQDRQKTIIIRQHRRLNPALSLLMKHLFLCQRQKAPNFSAFHWSTHASLVSIGQHFIARG